MFRLAVKSVKHNPKRLILTAVAVALGVALVAATFTFTNSLSSGFHSLFEEIYSGTDVIVEADPRRRRQHSGDQFEGSDAILSPEDVAAVSAVDGVAVAGGTLRSTDRCSPRTPATLGVGGAALPRRSSTGPTTRVSSNSTLVDGVPITADDQVLLDVDSVDKLGYDIGDTVTIATEHGHHRTHPRGHGAVWRQQLPSGRNSRPGLRRGGPRDGGHAQLPVHLRHRRRRSGSRRPDRTPSPRSSPTAPARLRASRRLRSRPIRSTRSSTTSTSSRSPSR